MTVNKDLLTADQIHAAKSFYFRHYTRLAKLLAHTSIKVPVTESYDKCHPEAWKLGHWKWFLSEHNINEGGKL